MRPWAAFRSTPNSKQHKNPDAMYPGRYGTTKYSKYPKRKGTKKYGAYQKRQASSKYSKSSTLAKNYRNNIVSMLRGPTPTQAYVKLKVTGIINVDFPYADYNETDLIASTLDAGSPNGAAFTQQPTGFDQWSALFQRFTVLGSSCKVDAQYQGKYNAGGNLLGGGRFIALTVLPSSMTLAQVRAAADAGGTGGSGNRCDLQNDKLSKTVHFSRPDASSDMVQIKHYCKTKTLFPDKDVVDDSDFQGTTASFTDGLTEPIKEANWYFCLQATEIDASGDEDRIRMFVTITYYTLFSSPVNVFDT